MTEVEIAINEHGYCSNECQFFGSDGLWVFCHLSVASRGQDNATRPGPKCPGVGRYRLVRVEKEETEV